MKILQNQVKQAEFARSIWTVTPETGVSAEELTNPLSWAHVAKSMKKGDRIEVTPPDGAWFAELYVVSSADNTVNVKILRLVELADAVPAVGGYEIKWVGPNAKFRVIRKADKEVIKDGFDTKEAATEYAKGL